MIGGVLAAAPSPWTHSCVSFCPSLSRRRNSPSSSYASRYGINHPLLRNVIMNEINGVFWLRLHSSTSGGSWTVCGDRQHSLWMSLSLNFVPHTVKKWLCCVLSGSVTCQASSPYQTCPNTPLSEFHSYYTACQPQSRLTFQAHKHTGCTRCRFDSRDYTAHPKRGSYCCRVMPVVKALNAVSESPAAV